MKDYQRNDNKEEVILSRVNFCNSCSLKKENEELKAQIEQLSNDNHVLKTSFITQQEQIEKMKRPQNCKHFKIDCVRFQRVGLPVLCDEESHEHYEKEKEDVCN